ncbi:MAG TPA: serine/threonine-protein kinase, partial [Gemmataceae bacterium]|nr:serine/threonine-protein kinase [Gemmataceae bacterium]
VAEACEYVRQAALGLQHAHEQGMVHRDVKPHNLMRTLGGQIKILDFGLARLAMATEVAEPTASPDGGAPVTPLTMAGSVMGTADYIAPEQANDSHKADIRADIYSLGCTLYQLLTGRTPFVGGSALDKVMRHTADQPDAPGKLRRGLPAGLPAVVLKMMAKDPAKRYQTPAEVASGLVPFASRRRKRWPLITAAAVVVAAAALVVPLILPNKRPAPPAHSVVPSPEDLAKRPNVADMLPGESSLETPERVAVLGGDQFRVGGLIGFPAYSPDGKTLAVPDGPEVLLLDALTGRPARPPLSHVSRVLRVGYSLDGRFIAAATTPAHWIKIWDAAAGREIDCRIPADACGSNAAFDFGPDEMFAVADAVGAVHLFAVPGGMQTAVLAGGPKDVSWLAVRPDGKAVAAAGRDGTVCVWDVPGGAAPRKFALPLRTAEENVSVAYSQDGSLLAAGSESTLRVWDARSFAERWTAASPGAGLTAFVEDGGVLQLLAAGRDCSPDRERVVHRWRAADGADLGVAADAGKGLFAVYAVRPGGKEIAAAANGQRVVQVYDAETGMARSQASGHSVPVHALAYSPDGNALASGAEDGVIKLWSVAAGVELQTLIGHSGAVRALAFAPDGKTLASGGADGTVRLWNTGDGKLISNLPGHAGGVEDLAFSPEGKTLASCGQDHAVRLRDAATGRAMGDALVSDASVNGIAFDPAGASLVSVGDDQTVTFWDLSSHHKTTSQAGDVLDKAAFFPDGGALATAGKDGQLRRWDAKGTPLDVLSRSASKMTRLAIRADGRLIAATGADGSVRLWDPSDPSHRLVFFVDPLGGPADALALSPEGRYLAVAGADGAVKLYRLAKEGVVYEPRAGGAMIEGRRLAGHEQPPVHSVAFEQDGRHVLTCCPDNKVRRLDVETGIVETAAQKVRRNGGPVAFLADGAHLLTAGTDRKLRYWDFKEGKGKEVDALVQAIALSPDGRFALTCGDTAAQLWGVDSLTLLRTIGSADKALRFAALAQSDEQLLILTPGPEQTIRLWDGMGDKPLRVFPSFAAEPVGLCASTDGKRAAWGGDDNLIHVLDLKTGDETQRLPFRDGAVRAMAFSPDGRRLLAASSTGLLSLWDVDTGRALDRTRTVLVSRLAFSPDGQNVILGCDDATASIWRLPGVQQ